MSKLIDLTGQKIGHWTVLKRDKTKQTTYWICQCDCGTIKSVCASSLRNGKSTSCGCYRTENSRKNNGKFINEIGNRYGKLIILSQDEELSKEKHRAQWVCKCDCGNIVTVSSKCLREGKTKSCGCLISIGEENISKILNLNNINYQNQYGVSINNKWYRYDFAIFDNNKNLIRLIEFDGEQHYNDNYKHWGKDSSETQKRDKIKNNYAFTNNIPLIRIPYYKKDSTTINDLLGNEFLINNDEN